MSWTSIDSQKIDTPAKASFHPQNRTAVSRATARHLIDVDGWTQKRVADLFGRTQQWVSWLLKGDD